MSSCLHYVMPTFCQLFGVVFLKSQWFDEFLRIMRSQGMRQGFMQDKIIVSPTCFGGHMDVNC